MKIPENLFYTLEHEWADYKNDEVIIGITDYAQSQLGDIIFVELPEVGSIYKLGDIFGEIEAVKTVSDLFMPISGTVSEKNNKLEDNPQLINESPYEEGWIIKIQDANLDQLNDLLSAEEYKKEIGI